MTPPADARKEKFLAAAEAHWSATGGKYTVVRRIICGAIPVFDHAFDAEALLQEVQKEDALVSLSTVYRCLRSLSDGGLLDEVKGPGGRRFFSLPRTADQSSSHLVCTDCGKVFPLDNPCLGLRESQAVRRKGFHPRTVRLHIEAACETLHRDGHCPRRGD